MAIEVVLDVFSGRPNPSWALDSARESEFLSRLKRLQPADEKPPERPILGYRGFVVQSSAGSGLAGIVRVYGGMVQRDGSAYQDPDRSLERWLLDTAGANLEGSLVAMLSKGLGALNPR